MLPSVQAFLSGIIDYAGLFPPAKLPLDAAIRNFARYRTEPSRWMLGRFVIPATRLTELAPYARLLASEPPFAFSVLGRGGETIEAFQSGVAADLEAVAAFRASHGSAVLVDAFEVRWPAGALAEPAAAVLDGPTKALGLAGLSAVYEVPPTAPALLLAQMRGGAAGVKLRCGGLEAAAFPTPEQVAHVIAACRDNGLSLKFTAGLHHPVRHFDPGVRTRMHGFLNVFGAGVLAHARQLSEEQVREIVEDEDATHFAFDEAGFAWKQRRATAEEIAAARSRFVLSFGSCSFDEPRDDLRALGILT
jgi:hypothetical protein